MGVVPQQLIRGGCQVTHALPHPPASRSKQIGRLTGNTTETVVLLGRVLPEELWSAPNHPTVVAPDARNYRFPPQLVGALRFLSTPTSLPVAIAYLRESRLNPDFLALLVECYLATLIPPGRPQTKLAMFTGLRLTGLGAPTIKQDNPDNVCVAATPFDAEGVTISHFLYTLLYGRQVAPTDFPTQVARLAAVTNTPPLGLGVTVLEGLQHLLVANLVRFDTV